MTVNQYERVRAQPLCVACWLAHKPVGLLLCWPCHHDQKKRHDGDYGPTVEKRLAALEAKLGESP